MYRRLTVTACFAFTALLFPAGCGDGTPDSKRGEFPTRPIKLVVPFNAGGGTDAFARIVNKAIKDETLLPQPLVIINVGGAGATIGSRRVKNARPDGYTLLILHDAILTAKATGNVRYGPEAFEPIAGTGEVGMVIVVRDDSPYKSLKDLMNAAANQPGEVIFGANIGALTHFAGLMLEQKSDDAKFRYVQLGGGADRFAKLIGGHIDVTGFSLEEFERFRPKGLRGLAVLSSEQYQLAGSTAEEIAGNRDAVPTARSQGYDVAMTNTFYWWAPKGTPPDRVRLLANVLQKAMQSEGVRKWAKENQCDPVFLEGNALEKRITASEERYSQVTPPLQGELPSYPAVLLAGMAVVGVWIVAGRYRTPVAAPSLKGDAAATAYRTKSAMLCVGITLLYYVMLAFLEVDFRIATFLFVMAIGITLIGLRRPSLYALVLVAFLMSFGLESVLSGHEAQEDLHTLVVLTTDDGITGVGSCFTSGKLIDGAVQLMWPLLKGESAAEPERVAETLRQSTFWQGRGGAVEHAISGIDIALWDIYGKNCGQPVSRLLGGNYRDRIKPYGSMLFDEPEALKQSLTETVGRGFKAIKLGWRPFGRRNRQFDELLVRTARDTVGDDVELMVDAGGSEQFWPHGLNWARETAKMLADYDIVWFEEPLPPDDIEGYIELTRVSPVPIAGCEVLTRRQSFLPWIERRAVDIIQPDCTKNGGISESRKIGWWAFDHNITMVSHGWNTAIGLAADLQLAAAMPVARYVEYLTPCVYIEDLCKAPFELDEEGYLQIPQKPGLGVDLDREKVERYSANAAVYAI
eukprot:g26713.t1